MQSSSLKYYVIKRTLQAIPLVFIVIIVSFIIVRLAPGDPIDLLFVGYSPPPEIRRQLMTYWGLDRPLHEQLFIYMMRVLSGDLGFSYLAGKSVVSVIFERLPATLLLMLSAIILAALVGVVSGVVSSRKPYSLTDNLATLTSFIAYSMPTFWLGQILIITFALHLDLFPVAGMTSLRVELFGMDYVIDLLSHLVLPVITLTAWFLAVITRITRASMLEVLGQDYIVTARAKGVSENSVVWRHGLRNALLPVVTIIGFQFSVVLMGAILTETVFGWPGLGRLMYDSLIARDYPVITGIFIFVSTIVIAINLITDILYAFLDPRIRYK